MPKTNGYPGFAANRLTGAVHDSPAVLIHGPRQSGKTALACDHFRDHVSCEVDIVAEQGAHTLAGIEVKAVPTVTSADSRGLHTLKDAAGRRFACGVVLYDGAMSLRFGGAFFALPIQVLWEGP